MMSVFAGLILRRPITYKCTRLQVIDDLANFLHPFYSGEILLSLLLGENQMGEDMARHRRSPENVLYFRQFA